MEKQKLITAYAQDQDITFILRESYNGNELAETECIGWHYGDPTEEDTKSPKCKLYARHFNYGIEVIYTGGGIWLACRNLDENRYAIVGDDFDEGIAIYDRRNEDPWGDEEWPCQNMVECYGEEDMPKEFRKLYKAMYKKLIEERW